ncbi:MAG: glycine cleavage system protein GcvH [Clostridia bacterium]|jgi:glycine cleavage system H protein|nr:glycine cleavage system protein GcvH [Clostridia bacterium]MDD4146270.1 glycine cleavage system protein GcvH [Clostridia bacterium]
MYPERLKYTEEHEWLLVKEGRGIVGITDYAQNSLGDVVFVDLPEVGKKLKANESLGVVESVKAVSDIYAPCAGIVKRVNENLFAAPELLNDDPYGEGWLVEIEIEELAEALLTASEYEKFVAEEE